MKTALLFLMGLSVFADVVTMKDGRKISGHVESGDTREIHVKVGENAQTIALNEIQSIQFEAAPSAADAGTKALDPIPVPPAPAATGGAEPVPAPLPIPAPVAPQSFTLPAGTEVSVQTIKKIDSKTAAKDLSREYAASIADAVKLNGVAVLPAHAKAFLRVTNTDKKGPMRKPSITLALVAVSVSGQRINLEVGGLDTASGMDKKKAATWVLVAAAGGAVIGGALFGKPGAWIGAAGGTVTGWVIEEARQKVVIPPEQRFTFKLTQPLVVNLPGGAQ